MDKIDIQMLENLLGIYRPWAVKSIVSDPYNQILDVHIEMRDKKKLFGLLDKNKAQSSSVGTKAASWFYMPLGGFKCIVHAEVPVEGGDTGAVSLSVLQKAAFLGHSERNYSNYVRQKVALANIKGIPAAVVQESMNIDEAIHNAILKDLKTASSQASSLAYLPTEVDPVWRSVLTDKLNVRTKQLPFKLLLSKLKLSTAKADNVEVVTENARELRQFFISNTLTLEAEIDQICGVTNEVMRRQVSATRSKQRLVLPSLKNPVWIDLLTGKLKLNSHSVPLNLLISRQRVAFLQGKSSAAKVKSIETLREYFHKNHRTLKPELVLINRAMVINAKTELRLPNQDHAIWQRILADDELVPSKHMAYKLLLSKLRAQVQQSKDPVVRIEAARSIRNFMQQNQRSMQSELSVIAKQSKAV